MFSQGVRRGRDILPVQEWKDTLGKGQSLTYVFVAYFTQHFAQGNDEDMFALSKIAEDAAKAAGVAAYWVGASNMSDEVLEIEKDVSKPHSLHNFRSSTYTVLLLILPDIGCTTRC